MSHRNISAPVTIDKAMVIEGIQIILDMFETIGQTKFPRLQNRSNRHRKTKQILKGYFII